VLNRPMDFFDEICPHGRGSKANNWQLTIQDQRDSTSKRYFRCVP